MSSSSSQGPRAGADEEQRPGAEGGDARISSGSSFLKDELDTIDFGRVVLIFFVVAVPNGVLLVTLSGIGDGLKVFNNFAAYSRYGDYCFGAAAFIAALLYIANWPNWRRSRQVVSLVLPWLLGCAGTIFKCRKYPYGPLLMCIFLMVLLLGLLRAGPCRHCNRIMFYRVTYLSTTLFGTVLLAMWIGWVMGGRDWNEQLKEEWAGLSGPIYDNVWKVRALNYTADCGANRNLTAITSSEERADLKKACASANTVLFMVWISPLGAGICNYVIAAFVFLNGVFTELNDKAIERDLKRFVLFLVGLLTGMYCSTYAAGTSMRLGSTLMAFFFAGLIALVGWMLLEMGPEVITKTVTKSSFAGLVQKAASSDWVKALFVGVAAVPLPILYCLEMGRQKMTKVCGTRHSRGSKYEPGARGDSRDLVTEHTNQLLQRLSAFNWTGIFLKICILGEVFFLFQVGVAKATYVFLSWMNDELERRNVQFEIIVMVVAGVGITMFLLPPVPGVPVYVFTGIVIAAQAPRMESLGFWGCTAIAIAVAWVLKLIACTMQYMIGYCLGKSVKIQQLIGVDKVLTRAIQTILERRGLNLGKVAVLVGGPDWPVSVTCGILRLNIPQMLLGTAPAIVTSAPCCLAGAFLTKNTGGENSVWSALSSLAMTSAVVMQTGSMFLAVYYITAVIDKNYEELSQPREEHRLVEELTKKELLYTQAYAQATAWRSLGVFRKGLLLFATAMMLLQGFLFVFMDEMCFENFSVSSKIGDPLDDGGLGNNAWQIIIRPWGVIAMGLFGLAALLHFIIVKDLQCLAKREHARMLQGAVKSVPPQLVGTPLS